MINYLIAGATVLGYLAIGTFFLRFWKETRDRLFVIFAVSFMILGLNQLLLTTLAAENESKTYFYLVRFSAFLLILMAVLDKNRTKK